MNMTKDVATAFAESRACFERADRALDGLLPRPLSRRSHPSSRERTFWEVGGSIRTKAMILGSGRRNREEIVEAATGAWAAGIRAVGIRAVGAGTGDAEWAAGRV